MENLIFKCDENRIFVDTFNYKKFFLNYNMLSLSIYGLYWFVRYSIFIYSNITIFIFDYHLFYYHMCLHFSIQIIIYFIIHIYNYCKYNKKGKELKSLGEIIQKARIEEGLTRTSLANIIDVSSKTITRWEKNESKPSDKIFIKLCDVLKLDIDDENKFIYNNIKFKKYFIYFNLIIFGLVGLITGIYGVYYSLYLDVNSINTNITFLIPFRLKFNILLYYVSLQAFFLIFFDLICEIKKIRV